jgi:hypothetical protein
MRFREYKVTAVTDPHSLPTFRAVCVTGEDADCGATSGDLTDPDALTRWIAEHYRDTTHSTYERTTRATVTAQPGAWQ